MPRLLSHEEQKIEWTDINGRMYRMPPKPHRSNGIHVSGIIKHVLTTSGMLKMRNEGPDDEMPLCMAVGMAWEDWAVGLYPDMKWQPGEVELDGIYGSPDGITGRMLEEFKATWKSSDTRRDILKEKIWMWQLMAYLKMMKLTKARLHVLWVNGNYRPPSPVYSVYIIEFTKDEINQFWEKVMLGNKEYARGEVH